MPKLTYVIAPDQEITVDAPKGLSVMEVAHKYDIDIEGACGGSLACATCHVIVDDEWADRLNDKTDDEEDMLDMAFNLRPTSRLGCQIIMDDNLDGLRVTLPTALK